MTRFDPKLTRRLVPITVDRIRMMHMAVYDVDYTGQVFIIAKKPLYKPDEFEQHISTTYAIIIYAKRQKLLKSLMLRMSIVSRKKTSLIPTLTSKTKPERPIIKIIIILNHFVMRLVVNSNVMSSIHDNI